jgi:hypothetical protein
MNTAGLLLWAVMLLHAVPQLRGLLCCALLLCAVLSRALEFLITTGPGPVPRLDGLNTVFDVLCFTLVCCAVLCCAVSGHLSSLSPPGLDLSLGWP